MSNETDDWWDWWGVDTVPRWEGEGAIYFEDVMEEGMLVIKRRNFTPLVSANEHYSLKCGVGNSEPYRALH
jgi:hypothetical protein